MSDSDPSAFKKWATMADEMFGQDLDAYGTLVGVDRLPTPPTWLDPPYPTVKSPRVEWRTEVVVGEIERHVGEVTIADRTYAASYEVDRKAVATALDPIGWIEERRRIAEKKIAADIDRSIEDMFRSHDPIFPLPTLPKEVVTGGTVVLHANGALAPGDHVSIDQNGKVWVPSKDSGIGPVGTVLHTSYGDDGMFATVQIDPIASAEPWPRMRPRSRRERRGRPNMWRMGRGRLAMSTIESLATIYAPGRPSKRDRIESPRRATVSTTNRRDRRRWIRTVAPVFAVASDLLAGGERARAIDVLLEHVHMRDAVSLTLSMRHDISEDWWVDTHRCLHCERTYKRSELLDFKLSGWDGYVCHGCREDFFCVVCDELTLPGDAFHRDGSGPYCESCMREWIKYPPDETRH